VEKLHGLKSAFLAEEKERASPQKSASEKSAKKAVRGLLTWPAMFQGTVIAWRSPVRNTRLLIAYLPGTDPQDPLALVNVLVRDNRNFLPGMECPVVQVDERTYELVGPCPARRGRWK